MNKVIATLLFFLVGTPAARADRELRAEIAQAQKRVPDAFAALDALRTRVMTAPPPSERRGQVARAMRALGPDGLYPLLALVTDETLAAAPAKTRATLLVGALEAIGHLRDRRAAATLRAIVDGPEPDAQVARAAAEALGALSGDEEIAFLAQRAQPGQARERAAIAGLGYARRLPAASTLKALLALHRDGETTAALAEAMGWLGSSWAWQALGPAHAAEGETVRGELAEALVAAYPSYGGRAREAIGHALLLIQHPSTANRLATLRASAEPALAADVLELERLWQTAQPGGR